MVCTFFGNRNVKEGIAEPLRRVLVDLIENKRVTLFYVGNQGMFDSIVRRELKALGTEYPHIKYFVVLAYMPKEKQDYDMFDYSDTVYFDLPRGTPPRFAIDKRNRIMIKKSDYVVTYLRTKTGGAAKYAEIAEKQNKIVIAL